MKRVPVLAFVAGLFVAGAPWAPWALSQSSASAYIDVHAHLWGRPGGGSRMRPGGGPGKRGARPPQADWEAAAMNLLGHMDRYGVRKALLMPPPRNESNVDAEEYAGLRGVAQRHPDRFAVAAGGDVLNPLIHRYPPSQVTTEIRDRFRLEAERLARDGVRAFGEMTALHLSFAEGHPFEQASPDHPLFLLLAETGARHGIAIDLHMEAVPSDMAMPGGFRQADARLSANIPSLEGLLAHDRGARVVWQHIGWDNTGHMTVDLLRRLLSAHPNLFLALRVEERTRTMGGTPMPNRIVDDAWKVKADWLALFQAFPDRFVVGTDEFFGIPGQSARAPQSFEETWRILPQLPADLARKIGRDNAARIYGL